MPEKPAVVVDRAAASIAGIAYMESPGPTDHRRVQEAIAAYLYCVQNIRPCAVRTTYPSLVEVREFLTDYRIRRDTETTDHV